MPTNPNMVAIQTVTVGAGGASSIEFTSIPQTYTDLKVVFSVRDATNNNGVVKITFNGSATGYTARQLYGTGSSAASNTDYTGSGTYYGTEGSSAPSNATASTFSNCELYIPNYTSSNNKSISADSLYENNGTLAYQSLSAGLWSNSAAITSIKIAQFSGNNFAQYSTATLYGVTSAGYGAKATGGIITSDANYYYHTFLASGTFTPTSNITADYLVVAGGGGGGGAGAGGGGGAGGLRCTVTATGGGGSLESALSLTASTNYTVTIGAGGAGGVGANTANSTPGTSGSNSVFSSITSTGGGGGAGGYSFNGLTGGSGGGASFRTSKTGGTGTTNQGYAGGNSLSGDTGGTGAGGGGGGAGATGATGVNGGAAGGAGVTTAISGTSVTYAGGGGGGVWDVTTGFGTGGSGGGGNGGTNTANSNGNAATVNTGSGGGGSGGGANGSTGGGNGGAGGSGIVIIRYAK